LRKTFLSRFDWKFWGYFKVTNDLLKIGLKRENIRKKKNRLSQEKRKKKEEKEKHIL
jgi:hypothetical protein